MHWSQVWVWLGLELHGFKFNVFPSTGLKPHDGAFVVASVEVVWGAEHRAEQVAVVPRVALLFDLVGAHHALQVVFLAESFCNIWTKRIDALRFPVRGPPAVAATGIAPHQVHEESFVNQLFVVCLWANGVLIVIRAHLKITLNGSDLVKARRGRERDGVGGVVSLARHPDPWVWARQAGMEHKHFFVNEVRQWQAAECF
mmetsp:Transcript_98177/g.189596  ORF Transcript_98177/g.189596 Transcript_98177/m.189596 type:complete len:200 (-) Transcript_98177:892-1491(-)